MYWIGLIRNVSCSPCSMLRSDGWSDSSVTVIITCTYFCSQASSDQLIEHNFILRSSLDKELAHPSKLKWDSKVTTYHAAPGQCHVHVFLSQSTSPLILLSRRLSNLNCLAFPRMFCRVTEFSVCQSPKFPFAHAKALNSHLHMPLTQQRLQSLPDFSWLSWNQI